MSPIDFESDMTTVLPVVVEKNTTWISLTGYMYEFLYWLENVTGEKGYSFQEVILLVGFITSFVLLLCAPVILRRIIRLLLAGLKFFLSPYTRVPQRSNIIRNTEENWS